jgi:hypothetical protein
MGSNKSVTLVFEHLLDLHLNKDVIQLPLEYALKYNSGDFIVITRPNLFQKHISSKIKLKLLGKLTKSNHALYENKKFENLVSSNIWFLKACILAGLKSSTVFMYPFYGNPFLGSFIIRFVGALTFKHVRVILKLDSYFDPNIKISKKQILVYSIDYLFFNKIISDKELTFRFAKFFCYHTFYRKFVFIPNCTSSEFDNQMSYVQKELNSFVFIGRIADEVKNFSSLFNSWLELHENEVLNEEILYVCGMIPKDLLLNYNKRLNEINKPNIVQFLGDLQISELKKLLLKSDIFINVSLKEGSPISIQEAIKCKCALILPDISNFSEILCGKLGLIPVPINELNITKTLSKVISNKELLNEQREKQYKKYSNNTWAKFINIINE